MMPVGILAGARDPFAIEYIGTSWKGDGSPVTWPNVAFGAPASSRLIVMALSYDGSQGVSAVTMGGIGATRWTDSLLTSFDLRAYIYAAHVPNGASGNVVATGLISGAASFFRVTGASPAPFHTAKTQSISSETLSLSLNVPPGGGLIALLAGLSENSSVAWTGAVENVDSNMTNDRHSAASQVILAGHTGRTVSVTGNPGGLCAASLRPI